MKFDIIQKMKSLNQFAGHEEVFKIAVKLPSFFDDQLVDKARIVMAFENDPQAHIRIFYYQYLKLCFELEGVNYDSYIHKIQEIINNPSFQMIFYQEDDPQVFNDTQAKSLIMQFFGVLGEGHYNVLKSLNRYPIMDTILVHFFRSFLILTGVTDSLDSYIPKDILVKSLSESFEVQFEDLGPIFRYVDANIYVYEQNQTAVYMAYLDEQTSHSQIEQQVNVNNSLQQPTYPNTQPTYANLSSAAQMTNTQEISKPVGYPSERDKQSLAKDSYIASQFLDFTGGYGNNLESLATKAKVTLRQTLDQKNLPLIPQPAVAQPQVKAKQTISIQPLKQTISEVINKPIIQSKPTQHLTSPNVSSNYLDSLYSNQYSSKYQTKPIIPKQQQVKYQPKNDYLQSFKQQEAKQEPKNDYFQQTPKLQQAKYEPKNDYFQQLPPLNPSPVPLIKPNTIQSSPPIQSSQKYGQLPPPNTQIAPTKDTFPSSYSSVNQLNSQAKLTSKNESQFTKDLFYNPATQTTKLPTSPKVDTQYDLKSQSFYGSTASNNIGSGPIVSGKKKAFGLNISQQFTNDNVSKFMAEPYRSNVKNMKDRARKFRNSLASYIK